MIRKSGRFDDDYWGPVPALAEMLARSSSRRVRRPARSARAAEPFRGIWGLCAKDLWPERLPALPPAAPDLWGRIGRFLAGALGRRARVGGPNVDGGAGPRLTDCHAWLAGKVLDYLIGLLTPPWEQFPPRVASVSQKAIAWALVAYALDARGPGALDAGADGSPLPKRYSLGPADGLGDFLGVHVLVEDLVARTVRRLGVAPVEGADRRPGGMRRQAFLQGYPALAVTPRRAAGDWFDALNVVIANSPLTHLVYADAVATPLRAGAARGAVRPGRRPAAWHDVWIAHLARALLGAILSGPPVHEKLVLAEGELDRAAAAAHAWAGRPVFFGRRRVFTQYPPYRQARRRVNALLDAARRQRRRRIAFLAGLFEDPADGAGYLQARAFDMLVRDVVTASAGEMRRLWPALARRGPQVRARDVFFRARDGGSGPGLCYGRFIGALFGCEVRDLSAFAGADAAGLADQVGVLLDPHVTAGADAAALADDAAVPKVSAQELVRRFADDRAGGVELPCAYPDDRGAAPASILARWYPATRDRLT